MSLLGIDVGSSSCKGMAFTDTGAVLAQATHAYAPTSPSPGRAEMEADEFWRAFVSVVHNLANQTDARQIQALAISSHGETFVPVDKTGQATAPAIMNSDHRAAAETEWWAGELGRERIYHLTGLPPHPMFALNKILWLRRHALEIYTRTDRFLSVADYLLVRLGLPPCTDYSLASRTMGFDLRRRAWSPEILEAAGLRPDQLGIPRQAGEKIGELSSSAAALLHLPAGTIVTLAGHDQPCGALGAGVTRPGEVADSAGTYECLTAVSAEPKNTAQALAYSLNSYCHVVPNQYVTLAFFPAGIMSRWFVEQFCGADEQAARESGLSLYDFLNAQVERLDPGPTGLCITPHLIGACNPHWDARATGVMVGLTPAISRHHVYKAIYEGLACELAVNAKVLEEVVGPFDAVRLHGGNARAPFSVQLRADLTGKTMEMLATTDAVCQGAAMLAGVAAGVYRNAEEAARRLASGSRRCPPNLAMTRQYARQLEQYQLIYKSLQPVRGVADRV